MNATREDLAESGRGRATKTRILHRIVLLTVLSIATMTTGVAGDSTHPQGAALREALAEMLQQERDPFVVVEVVGSSQFFQYAAGESDYVFDVPVASLTEGQLARARSYFEPRGVRLYRFAEAEPGTSDSSQFVFQKALAHDQLDEGVALGLGFLAEVLGAGDRALEVIRGWR